MKKQVRILVYSGKLSELRKTLDLIKKKETKISNYIFRIDQTIRAMNLVSNFPKAIKDETVRCILFPDGSQGTFIFDSEKILLAISFSLITNDYETEDESKFIVHPYVKAFFAYENGAFNDSGENASLGQIYNDELKSSKAGLLSAKAKSAVFRISKLKSVDEIENYLESIDRDR